MSRRLGFLWFRTTEDGSISASGFIETLSGDVPIRIVKNLHGTKETHAPYVILRKDQVKEQKEVEQSNEYLI